MRVHRLAAAVFLLFSVQGFAQTSDPQAVALAAKSMTAMTGGNTISDVTLSANVTSIAGSDQQIGTATLLAKGLTESRVDLSLNSGNRTDVRNGPPTVPEGAWNVNNGNSTHYAGQNCWSDAAWFFPALSSLSNSDPSIVLKYVGIETRNGVSVQHIQSYRYATPTSFVQQWSTTDFYLDAGSSLPVAIAFNVYPDDSISMNIPVEVDFSNYQAASGGLVAMHIQRYVQGSLALDVVVTGVNINSGLPDSDFAIQ